MRPLPKCTRNSDSNVPPTHLNTPRQPWLQLPKPLNQHLSTSVLLQREPQPVRHPFCKERCSCAEASRSDPLARRPSTCLSSHSAFRDGQGPRGRDRVSLRPPAGMGRRSCLAATARLSGAHSRHSDCLWCLSATTSIVTWSSHRTCLWSISATRHMSSGVESSLTPSLSPFCAMLFSPDLTKRAVHIGPWGW